MGTPDTYLGEDVDTESLRKKESALGTILDMMEVPAMRKETTIANLRWLQRNLAVQNSEHPLFSTARTLLKEILKENQKST